jgi:hypothetical protein
MLMVAAIVTPRVWQDRPVGVARQRWRDVWRGWRYGRQDQRKDYRRALLEVNPIFWLAARDRLRPVRVWCALALIGGAWIWAAIEWRDDWWHSATYFLTAYGLAAFVKVWVASSACDRFLADRRDNALELLLCTPLSVPDLLCGQIFALRRQFQGPALAVLFAQGILLLAPWWDRAWAEERGTWMLLCGGVALWFVADAWALAWVGMWMGLVSRHANHAAANSLLRVLVLPWVIFLLGTFGFVMLFRTGAMSTPFEPSEETVMWMLLFLGLGNSAFWGFYAGHNLRSRLREIAARRFQPATRDVWSWLFGRRNVPAKS